MTQIALPLGGSGTSRIVIGNANEGVVEAFENTAAWPFRTAILFGPPRSGKSLLARWFIESERGDVIDNALALDETEFFHRWNRAQEQGTPLLVVGPAEEANWQVALPDLASRLGAALRLTIGTPDDAMLAELIAAHAEQRGLILGEGAAPYLVPRMERSHIAAERLVAAIDRLSFERKQAATLALWRDALEEVGGQRQARLL
ncbi:MAG: ATPase [Novosphingobium sp.]|nr:ATPase [Novosphingobium sp.]